MAFQIQITQWADKLSEWNLSLTGGGWQWRRTQRKKDAPFIYREKDVEKEMSFNRLILRYSKRPCSKKLIFKFACWWELSTTLFKKTLRPQPRPAKPRRAPGVKPGTLVICACNKGWLFSGKFAMHCLKKECQLVYWKETCVCLLWYSEPGE